MIRGTRQSPAVSLPKPSPELECALVDIKAKALGISVVELFGGPTRDKVRVTGPHCGTSRARHHELIGVPTPQNDGRRYHIGAGSGGTWFHCTQDQHRDSR